MKYSKGDVFVSDEGLTIHVYDVTEDGISFSMSNGVSSWDYNDVSESTLDSILDESNNDELYNHIIR